MNPTYVSFMPFYFFQLKERPSCQVSVYLKIDKIEINQWKFEQNQGKEEKVIAF